MKIRQFNIENVKRVKAVHCEVPTKGLYAIGGKNSQGKTSIIDALLYALCGEKYRPTNIQREGTDENPYVRVEMDNGLVVERKGKNSELKVIDPTGKSAGQTLLNKFISELACNIPSFLHDDDKGRAKTLLNIIGLEDVLKQLDEDEKTKYEERTICGRVALQKEKFATEMTFYPDMPESEISAKEITDRLQAVMSENAKVEVAKRQVEQNRSNLLTLTNQKKSLEAAVAALERQVADTKRRIAETDAKIDETAMAVLEGEKQDFTMQNTSKFDEELANIEATNEKVRANKRRMDAIQEANEYKDKQENLTAEIEAIRQKRKEILENADLPYPGLSVQNQRLYLDGKAWDCMSSSQQATVACAICCRIKPTCEFMFLDKMEMYDADQLEAINKWAVEHDKQIIGTRVSSGDECAIIIEDGAVVGQVYERPEDDKPRRATKAAVAVETSPVRETTPTNDTATNDTATNDAVADAMARAKQRLAEQRAAASVGMQG